MPRHSHRNLEMLVMEREGDNRVYVARGPRTVWIDTLADRDDAYALAGRIADTIGTVRIRKATTFDKL